MSPRNSGARHTATSTLVCRSASALRAFPRLQIRLAVAAIGISVLVLALGVFFVAERANAALQEVAESGETGYLSLRADPHPFIWQDAQPGEQKHWLIEASLSDAAEGTLALELRADGELVYRAEVAVAVSTCSLPFTAAGPQGQGAVADCSGELVEVLPTTPLADLEHREEVFPLANLREGEPRNLLVTLSIPEHVGPESVGGASSTLAVGLHASGDLPRDSTPEPEGLAQTGSNALALGVLAIGAIGLGLSVRWFRRARKDSAA